jgi:hypothetical protein
MVDRVSRRLTTFSDEREISESIPVLGCSARRLAGTISGSGVTVNGNNRRSNRRGRDGSQSREYDDEEETDG